MAQRTLFPAFEIWSLIPGEDIIFAQCPSIRILQSANQKSITDVIFETFRHTRFFPSKQIW